LGRCLGFSLAGAAEKVASVLVIIAQTRRNKIATMLTVTDSSRGVAGGQTPIALPSEAKGGIKWSPLYTCVCSRPIAYAGRKRPATTSIAISCYGLQELGRPPRPAPNAGRSASLKLLTTLRRPRH
jgi:hypothetical protein